MLLGTVAAGALLFAYGRRAYAGPGPCPVVGTTMTCTGDHSAGIATSNPITLLNVNNLTTNIAPASGTDGINFTSTGSVTLNSDTSPFAIIATGAGAEGIFARSSVSGSVTVNSTGDISSALSKGILAQTQSGTVTVTTNGTITALDDAIFAQSQTGPVTVSHTGDLISTSQQGIYAKAFSGAASVTISGAIAASDEGIYAVGTTGATVSATGDISTSGTGADGIYAVGNGAVTVNATGDIATSGAASNGIFAYVSIVAGAASVTSVGDIATQGTDSGGIEAIAYSGAATVTSTGDIATQGANAEGIRAYAYSSGDATVTSAGDIATQGEYSQGIEARANNGSATVTSTGDIATQGDNSAAIDAFATGGSATVVSTGNIATYGDYAGGIFAAGTGVSVTSAGNIATFGALGNGIEANSSGGASIASTGNVFSNDGRGIDAGGSGTGAVTIISTGDVTAVNDTALYARSVGTGPVSVTSNGTLAAGLAAIRAIGPGAVTVDSTGDITSSTNDGVRVMSSSSATVILRSGIVHGAVDGVEFVGGASTGTLRNYASLSGGVYAVSAGAGNDTVHNYGTITGNIRGVDTFNNRAGGLFNAGDAVEAGTLNNAGTFAPGGIGAIETTVMGDDLVQAGSGIFAVDVSGGASDQVIVSDTAVLAGTVSVNVIGLPTAVAQQFTILQALGGVTNNGLALSASPALHASLAFTATTVLLTTSIDFALSGLSPNERAIGSNLNSALAAGGGNLGPLLLALLNTPGLEAYEHALDQLSPEIVSDAQIAALYATLGFSSSLLSCRVNGTDTASIIREGQCLWAGASARFLDSGSTFNQIGFTEAAGLFAAGAQVALDDVWRLGVGAAYQSSWLKSATNATSEGEQAQAGVAVKYNPGPLLLAGVLNGGRGWYDTTRPIAFGGFAGTAQGTSEIDILNGGVRAAYVFGAPQLYFKPMLDAAATRLALGGFTETGGGAANLVVQGQRQTVYSIAPTLEVGTEWWLANGTLVRPFLRGGAVWYEGGDLALSAGFLGAPAGVAPFTILTDMDDVMGVVGAGIDVINARDAALRLSYDGQLGETTHIHAVALKGSASF